MAMVSGMPVFHCSSPSPRWKHSKGARCLGPQGDLAYQLDDGFSSFILPLPLPSSPVLFPRKNLNPKFAVLLMRSAYDAADELDFIAMDKFQMKFWKLRQSELEPYTLQYRPLKVKYGDLTDPLYFDFISFAQFATISNEMRNGQYVFQLIEGISKLLQLFVDQGYALNANVEEVNLDKMSNDLILRIRLLGSSTLWGMRTLASRRASVLTDFDALAVKAFLEASSRKASFNIHFTDTYKEEIWTVGNKIVNQL